MEEQRNRLLELVQLRQRNLQKIKSKLGQAEDLLKCGCDIDYVYEELLNAVSLTEKFNLNIRDLAYYVWGPYAYDQVKEIIADTVPVEIGYTMQGWFSVRLPMLLPKKQSGGLEYIRSILFPKMENFFAKRLWKKQGKVVLVYRHVYDKDYPERNMRDHDNIEINQVTDIVALFTMVDDNPACCEHFYMSAKGKGNRTEVYVIPRNEFEEFLKIRQEMPEEGVPLYENEP